VSSPSDSLHLIHLLHPLIPSAASFHLTRSIRLTYTPSHNHPTEPNLPHATLDALIEANVRVQVNNAANSDPIRSAWAAKREVKIHGLVYDIASGHLRNIGFSREPPAESTAPEA
jgi:carbonic anhydrase